MSDLIETHSVWKSLSAYFNKRYNEQQGLQKHSILCGMHHPYKKSNFNCTVMLLSNLAKPQWISVHCQIPLIHNVVCHTSKKNETIESYSATQKSCCNGHTVILNICYSFTQNMARDTKHKCWQKHRHDIKIFKYLISAASSTFPPLFSCNFTNLIQYNKIWGNYSITILHHNSQKGLAIYFYDTFKFLKSGNLFECNKNYYISYMYVCDGNTDCNEDSLDELECHHNYTKSESCAVLHHLNASGNCNLYLFLMGHEMTKQELLPSNYKQYNLDAKTISTKENVLIYDQFHIPCAEKLHNHDRKCNENGLLVCTRADFNCYNISDVCTYTLDTFSRLLPCRFGEHLEDCVKFECNIMLKCPDYYCISWAYVCDGKWDCPGGLDESSAWNCGPKQVCKNLFKCKGSQRCIHLGDVCDDTIDCPAGDDELLCSLWDVKNRKCPVSCSCLVLAIKCVNVTSYLFQRKLPYQAIYIKESTHAFLTVFTRAIIFTHVYSGLVEICDGLNFMTSLIHFNASFNRIQVLYDNCFDTSLELKSIILKDNFLSNIHRKAFSGLTELLVLDISNNYLKNFSGHGLSDSKELNILSIFNNSLIDLTKDSFDKMNFKTLQTDDYRLCCIVSSGTKCTADIPWYISCTNLLPNTAVKVTFYCFSGLIFISSTVSLILQVVSYKKRVDKTAAFATVVASINIADIICALPLVILWVTDLIHGGEFSLQELRWRTNPMCFIIFGLFLYFNLLSPLLLCFLAFTRFMVVIHPIDSDFRDTKFVMRHIISLILLALVVAAILTFISWIVYENIPTPLCSPFLDPTDIMVTTKIFTWIVIIVQVASIVFIIIIYINLVKALKKSENNLQGSTSKQRSNTTIIIQILVVTVSNIICWIPSGVIYLVSMFMERYPIEMLVWTTVVVVPVNSVINPVVFIITTSKKMLC